jgi:hypothetical protein
MTQVARGGFPADETNDSLSSRASAKKPSARPSGDGRSARTSQDAVVIVSGAIVQTEKGLVPKPSHPPSFYRLIAEVFGLGEDIEIEVRRPVRKRSLKQNAGFHAMVSPWAQSEGYDIAELKRDLLGEVFGWREDVSPLSQQRMPNKPHTSDLSVEEFSLLIERTLQIAAECNVFLLAPNEYNEQKQKRAKKGKVE